MSHRADLCPSADNEPLSNRMKRRANIPELYWKSRLDLIPPTMSHYKPIHDYVATMHETEKTGQGLILTGRHGSGKSSIACCLLMEAMLRGPVRCYYVSAADVPSLVIDKPVTASGESVWELVTGRAQFLVIDDLGDERTTDWKSSAFTRVFNSRRGAMRSTFITTNCKLEAEDREGVFDLFPRLKQLGPDAHRVLPTDDRLQWRTGF